MVKYFLYWLDIYTDLDVADAQYCASWYLLFIAGPQNSYLDFYNVCNERTNERLDKLIPIIDLNLAYIIL